MGCNLVDLEVRNRLEIEGGVWNNRTLIRDDKLTLHNFDGLSGSPVVSMSGRVTGIIVLQINETLSYLSVSKAKEHLDNKGIRYDIDWVTDDITTMVLVVAVSFAKMLWLRFMADICPSCIKRIET